MAGQDAQILARWDARIRGANCTPLLFFELVTTAIEQQQLSDIDIVYSVRREGGLFSPRRVYLRVRYDDLFFDVSALVAGTSLIVGYWLHRDHPGIVDLLSEIPGIRIIRERWLRPTTYFAVDYVRAFQQIIHGAILDVVDDLSQLQGLVHLPEVERVPVWEQVW